jgi:FkbM family methyltransferase
MEKTLALVGHEVLFEAADGDYYLENMSTEGPVDLKPVFETFCHTGSCVIDVGANIGITAVLAGFLVAPGSVLAVEPVPEAFRYLEQNVATSKLTNVKCVNAAAASEEGEVRLVVHPGWNFAAFVGYPDVLDRYPGYAEQRVHALSIDDLVASEGLSRVDFMKIDTEGYELEVLRGAVKVLSTFEPCVFLEVNHYCLNIFRRMSLVDFIEEILATFPLVYALDTTFAVIDLTDKQNHQHFFHENVVRERFPNLICGFTPAARQGVERLQARYFDSVVTSAHSPTGPADPAEDVPPRTLRDAFSHWMRRR